MNTFNQSTYVQKVVIIASAAILLMGVVLGVSYATTAYANHEGIMVSSAPNSGTIGTGSTLDVFFAYPYGSTTATSTMVTSSSCMVNGVDVKNSFRQESQGVYKATYTVGASDASRNAGEVPVNCVLSGDTMATVTAFTDGNMVSINAGAFPSNGNGTSTPTTTPPTTPTTTPTTTPPTNTGTSTGSVGGSVTGGVDEDNGMLAISSISQVKSVASAGGGFDQGWAWMFHVTVPTNESNLELKFNDWVHSNGSSTIPVANNMRISSSQANATSTIMLTGSGVYSFPLMLNADMDPAMPGRQIHVLVEMQVPAGSVNGSYTTGYGVQSYE